jgi:hypothetical protein
LRKEKQHFKKNVKRKIKEMEIKRKYKEEISKKTKTRENEKNKGVKKN